MSLNLNNLTSSSIQDNYDQHIQFPYKLWIIINKKNYVIYWSKMGNSILINYTNLEEFLLKQKLLNIKYCSTFIKELNVYGFRKINRYKKINNFDYNKNDLIFEYEHKNFQRNRNDLLKMIKRKNEIRPDSLSKNDNCDLTMCFTPPYSSLQYARENLRLTLGMQTLNKQADLFIKQLSSTLTIPVVEVPANCFENPLENIPKYVQDFLENQYEAEQSSETSNHFYLDFVPMQIDDIRTAIDNRQNSVEVIHPQDVTIDVPNISNEPIAQSSPLSQTQNSIPVGSYAHPSTDDFITILDQPIEDDKFEIKNERYDFQIINDNMAPLEYQVANEVSAEDRCRDSICKNEYFAESFNQTQTPVYQEMYFDQIPTIPPEQIAEEYLAPRTVNNSGTLPSYGFNQFDLPQPYDDNYTNDNMLYDIHLPSDNEINPDYFNHETLQNVENAIENFFTQIRESIDILNN